MECLFKPFSEMALIDAQHGASDEVNRRRYGRGTSRRGHERDAVRKNTKIGAHDRYQSIMDFACRVAHPLPGSALGQGRNKTEGV